MLGKLTNAKIVMGICLPKSLKESTHNSIAGSHIPAYRSRTTKMWHFGFDTIDEYTRKKIEVTFEEGVSDLYKIYTKRMKDGKNRVRVENQEYPNQAFADALVRKLYPDAHLVVVPKGVQNNAK
jgi:hypothetical protein